MRSSVARNTIFRTARFESLESRRFMSATPHTDDPDFVLDYILDVQTQQQPISRFSFSGTAAGAVARQASLAQQSLANAHLQTGLTAARSAYGLTGRGQTVAIIDTGLAYDHTALGGGWGNRMVGGWDFAENDWNPYDDVAGAHGTHVAGIVGNTEPTNPGVATGVDFVALRVFNDSGSGQWSWVENALQWVYQNRNSFRNPITTVNMSLGAVYNGNTAPYWGMLEDEFAALKSVGIFVAVAAGNAFSSYGTPGLSYPGASTNVVPVSALNGTGDGMAWFSQRLDRVIAAPGSSIRSTVPDHAGDRNGIADDFANMSGTSMASPYVAGAAALIREALAFAGTTNITQDTIYNVMFNTADLFYDAATNQNYRKLNLQRAIDSIMPADDVGSTVGTARNLGNVTSTLAFNGAVGRTDDHDFFTFTAAASGTLAFIATANYDLAMRWEVVDGGGSITNVDSNSLALDVVAGQTYTIGVTTRAGVGHYTVNAQLAVNATNLGTADFRELTGVSVNSEKWYEFRAARGGALTVEALYDGLGGDVDLKIYNGNFQELAASDRAGNERVDILATSGARYFVQVTGTNADVDFRVVNMLGQTGRTILVYGSAGNDVASFTAGATHQLTVNGTVYNFGASYISGVNFDGAAGSDSLAVTGTTGVENATLRVLSGSMSGTGWTVNGTSETITVNSGGGADVARFYDSAGNDLFVADAATATLSGGGYSNTANGFARVEATASRGTDVATLYDSAGNDTYITAPTYAAMIGTGFYNLVFNFDNTRGEAVNGGSDVAAMFDSAGNELFASTPTSAGMYGAGWYHVAQNFERVWAYANAGGWDMAYYYDSAGDDSYVAATNYSWLAGAGYQNAALYFDLMVAYSRAGNDTATLNDGIGSDNLETDGSWAKLTGTGYYEWANGFDDVTVNAVNGGTNVRTQRAAIDYVLSRTGSWA